MDSFLIWQAAMPAISLLWLLAVSLRMRRLSRRLIALEPAAQLVQGASQPSVSVAELVAREERTRRPKPPPAKRSSDTTGRLLDTGTQPVPVPVPRPRKRIDMGPRVQTDDDPGPWFRPARPPGPDQPAGIGSPG